MASRRPTRSARAGTTLAVAAVVLGLSAANGCGDGSQPQRQRPPTAATKPLAPAAAKESLAQAQRRITAAVASPDCAAVNALNPVGRELDTPERCTYLRRLAGLEPTRAATYGDAGAVIDYADGDAITSAILIRDQDGRFHVAFLDPSGPRPAVGTKRAEQFDDAAHAAVDALSHRDCDAFEQVVFRDFGRGFQGGDLICEYAQRNPIEDLLRSYPKAKLQPAGGNGTYAFYTLASPYVNYTLVFGREDSSPNPRYGFIDAYPTNVAAAVDDEQEGQ